jgi:hypothetical protein
MNGKATSILRRIERSGGTLRVDGEDILFTPGDPSTADNLEDALRSHKAEVIRLLQLRDDPLPVEWLTARCAFDDSQSEETSELLIDLAQWKVDMGLSYFATRMDFEAALKAEGFHIADGRVHGLIFAHKLEGCAR